MDPRRRRFLAYVLTTSVGFGLVGAFEHPASARAAAPVKVSNVALGCLVAAIGGSSVTIVLDASIPATHVQIGEHSPVDVTQKILLKGEGQARWRYLDDARNSAPVGSAIKQALSAALPQAQSEIETAHRQWATAFARRVLAWNKLVDRKLVNRTLTAAERIYLLEWAGAKVGKKGDAGPAGLAKAPNQPNAPTLAAYEAYIDALLASLAS